MKLGTDYKLVQAKDTVEGDEIMFDWQSANYLIEQIDTDPIGNIRHIHDNGMASSSYEPGQLLRVRLDPITAYYKDKSRPGQPPAIQR